MKKYCLPGLVFLAACSGAPDATQISAAPESGEISLGDIAPEAALDAKFEGALGEGERQGALAAFAANGIARENVEFRGRVAIVEGDIMIDVDEVLAPNRTDDLLNKGFTASFVNTAGSGFSGCAPYQCGPFAPTLYSRFQSTQYQFLRPDTQNTYYLVVSFHGSISSTRRATVLSWIGTAASRIASASSTDCINTSNVPFLTVTDAEYAALGDPLGSQHHVTTINVYTTASTFAHRCSSIAGADVACANLPGDRGIRNDSKQLSPGRHRFGDRIHMNLDTVETIENNWIAAGRPAAGGAVGVILHEMGHTLGFGHTGGESSYIRVPGTSNEIIPNRTNTSVPQNRRGSVMCAAPSDMDRWQCLTGESGLQCLPQEDELMMTKLYSGSCNFSTSFRNVN